MFSNIKSIDEECSFDLTLRNLEQQWSCFVVDWVFEYILKELLFVCWRAGKALV